MAVGPALAKYTLVSGPNDVTPGSGACVNLLNTLSNIGLAPGTGTPLPVTGEYVATEEYLPDQSNATVTNSQPRSMALEPLWIIDRIQDAELNQGDGGVMPSTDAGPGVGLPTNAGFGTYPYLMNNAPAAPPADPTNKDRPYAWGFFDSLYPNSDGVCTAHLNPSVIDLPDIPEHQINIYSTPTQSNLYGNPPDAAPPYQGTGLGMDQPDQPPTHVEYTWTNVRALQSGASVGQQMWADLTITRDGCTASYQVALLSPQTPCASTSNDDAGNPLPDLSQCSPTAVPDVPNPSLAQLYGSGLPVGVPVACQDLNALPAGFDAGAFADAGAASTSPDWECMPTKTAP
jgi:hypothetical protein